jgi:hypothetical protein
MRHGIGGGMKAAGEAPEAYPCYLVIAVEGDAYSAMLNKQLIVTLTDSKISQGYVGLRLLHINASIHVMHFMFISS